MKKRKIKFLTTAYLNSMEERVRNGFKYILQ